MYIEAQKTLEQYLTSPILIERSIAEVGLEKMTPHQSSLRKIGSHSIELVNKPLILENDSPSLEVKKAIKIVEIGSNSMDLIKVSKDKEIGFTTSDLTGETAVAVFAKDEKGTRYIYVQNYDRNPVNEQKSIKYLKNALLEDFPKNSTIDTAFIVTPEGHEQNGKNTGSPKNELLTSYLQSIIEQASGKESNADIQIRTYEENPEKRQILDYEVTLKGECLSDHSAKLLLGSEQIKPLVSSRV